MLPQDFGTDNSAHDEVPNHSNILIDLPRDILCQLSKRDIFSLSLACRDRRKSLSSSKLYTPTSSIRTICSKAPTVNKFLTTACVRHAP